MVSFHRLGLRGGALALLALAACARESTDEMSWARAALERNNRLEVVAADRDTRTFTVRLKDTGELRMVRVDQLMAAPAAAAAATTVAGASGHAAASAGAAEQAAAPISGANSVATSPPPATAGVPAVAPAEERGPIARSQPSSLTPQTGPGAEAAPGRVLASGPGYSIKAVSAGTGASGGGRQSAIASSTPLERRHEPIVCQGSRLLHLDNRNLLSDGDAVSAEDGCEVYITNSRIRAAHVGVSARRANVHIDNSLIEGDDASIEASEGAQVYAGSTRFKGLSRRLDTAAFHDLGGNVWN